MTFARTMTPAQTMKDRLRGWCTQDQTDCLLGMVWRNVWQLRLGPSLGILT